MSWQRGILERARALFRRGELDRDLSEEIRFHIDMEINRNLEAGMDPREARRQAHIAFGGVDRYQEQAREERGVRPLEDLWGDVRFSMRMLRKSPGFTAVAILSLSVGIGANTAIFSIVDQILMSEKPYRAPDELMNVYRARAEDPSAPPTLSYPDFLELEEATDQVFSHLGGYQLVFAQRELADGVETLVGELVTGDYFPLLGVGPMLGRTIGPEDHVAPGAHSVVTLGYRFWRSAFGGDPDIVGQSIRLNGREYSIVGVTPRDFPGSTRGIAPDFFAPIMMVEELIPLGANVLESRGSNSFLPVGRLAAGVSGSEAAAALARVSQHLRRSFPDSWPRGDSLFALPTREVIIAPALDAMVVKVNLFGMAVVGLVLLIACTNLTSFLLARASGRRREVALRLALGARRERLIRQLVTETLVLGLLAGAVALPLAVWVLELAKSLTLGFPMPVVLGAGLDRTVLGFTLVVALGTGILAGLIPALQATRPEIAPTLRDETTGSEGTRVTALTRFLVGGQVAVSVVLLVTAGLLIRSFDASKALNPGFGTEPTGVLGFMIPSQDYSPDEGRVLLSSVLDEVRDLPEVERAGAISNIHLNTINSMFLDVNVDGTPPPPGRGAHIVDFTSVDEGFFDAAGIEVLEGRTFRITDDSNGRPVAVINQAFARQFWPGESPLGRTIRVEAPGFPDVTVVGVVSNAKIRSLGEGPRPFLYLPFNQEYNAWVYVLAVTRSNPEVVSRAIYRLVRDRHPEVVVTSRTTMTEHIGIMLMVRRLGAILSGVFSATALGLVLMGLFGVVSHSVARRGREMGIRMSLGAEPRSVVSLQLKQGLRLILVGGLIGLAGAAVVARMMGSFVYGVSTIDPVTFVGVPLVLVAATGLAAYLPARKASRVNPVDVLRRD